MGFEKKINNPKEDSSRSDGGDAGSDHLFEIIYI
jgi:hypothetical protein